MFKKVAKSTRWEGSSWDEVFERKLSFIELIRHLISNRYLILAILKNQPSKMLEIGAGSGALSAFFSQFFSLTFSIDNNIKIISRCNKLYRNRRHKLFFMCCDAFKLPFKRDAFDVVFSEGFFEHFSADNIKLLLREQLRVGKYVIFIVPNKYYGRQDLGNENLWSKEAWEKILSGFNLVKSKNCNFINLNNLFKSTHYLAIIQKK